MGGATLKSFEMGLASKTDIPYGLAGIAYANSEANVFTGNGSTYPNLVDALVNQGVIPTQAYSLWLDDIREHFLVLRCNIDANHFSRSDHGPDPLRRH